ncbi:ATP-binding protein [Paraburkholderia sp. BCC1884]|uniref:ATP-binding protein n=1 Tax=Paraburkholderia sp. BCC1884 TaxID=2562668 RepID=UPI00118469FD|nr:AAA family ATPase [Paraburkholderia sp. BCC1884]
MSHAFQARAGIRFSGFLLDAVNQCLWSLDGAPATAGARSRVDLPPKTFDVLRYLAEHANELVRPAQVLDAVWPDVYVQPEIIKSHIAAIRRALGDSAAHPRIVETVRGRGYRLILDDHATQAVGGSRASEDKTDPFVGRTQEQDLLLEALRRAHTGERQIVFVAGEAGIGKTALIGRWRDSSAREGLRSAGGGCVEGYGGAEPFYPFFEALGRLCRLAGGDDVLEAIITIAPTWAVVMPAHVPAQRRRALQADLIGAGPERMMREGCMLFETLAAERTLLLTFDDLQWSDFASIDLLSMLAQRHARARLMVICSFRVEEVEAAPFKIQQLVSALATHRGCTVLRLQSLSHEAIGRWLTAGASASPVDQEFAHLLAECTDGNPLFVRALLDHLLELSLVCRHGDGWRPLASAATIRSALPPTVMRALEARIQRLDADMRRLLEAASVAGQVFSSATVASVVSMSPSAFDDACDVLLRTGQFIRDLDVEQFPDGSTARRFAFQHALIRQAFYVRQGIGRRSASHRSIAAQLEQRFPPDQRSEIAAELCLHFSDARLWEKALDYLRIALELARARYSHRDALALLDQSDKLVGQLDPDAQRPWRIEFGEVRAALLTVAHDPLAVHAYLRLFDDASCHGDLDVQLRALLGLSHVLSWTSQSQAVASLDDALRLSASHPNPKVRALTRINCHVRRIWILGWSKEDDEACHVALETLRESGDTLALARGELEYAMPEIVSTRYAAALAHVEAGFGMLLAHAREYPQVDLARGMWMMQLGSAWASLMLGEFSRSFRQFEAGIRFYQNNGNYLAARTLEVYRGWLLVHTMDYETILASDKQFRSSTEAILADECRHLGNRDALLAPQRRAWNVVTGLAQAGIGNAAAAATRFAEVERDMEREPAMFDWHWRLALAWGVSGEALGKDAHDDSARHARQFLDLALATDERVWHGLAWERMAQAALEAGRLGAAMTHSRAAFAATDGFDTPLVDWRLHRTAAAVHRACGDEAASAREARLSSDCRLRLYGSLAADPGAGLRLRER